MHGTSDAEVLFEHPNSDSRHEKSSSQRISHKGLESFTLLLLLFIGLSRFTPCISNELCISPGGRFPPFSLEGKPPKKVVKGLRDLTFCRIFRKKTCCDVAQTHSALLSVRSLASIGEANEECLLLWELLECAICDPYVGVQPGPPLICLSFCDMVLRACASAYFAMNRRHNVLSPCGINDLLCGRASEWASNGTEFCHLAGYSVFNFGDFNAGGNNKFCYDGKSSLDLAESRMTSQTESNIVGSRSLIEGYHWLRGDLSGAFWWVVGVLMAGVFWLLRRSHKHQKQVAFLKRVRRSGMSTNQNFSVGHKIGRRIGK